jgi:hypothetical protein
MRGSLRTIALASALVIALLGAVGCGDIAAKVEAAENPAPAGTFEDVDVSSRVSLNDKANYAWEIDGTTYDAIADSQTLYKVDGESVSASTFSDAVSGDGAFEDVNEDTFDDLYNFRVQPDGVIIEADLILGE